MNMVIKLAYFGIIFYLFLANVVSSAVTEDIKLTVRAVTTIGKTDDAFVCATLDWWPSNKCDYNQCPWGQAGLLNLDLNNTILKNALKAFNPIRIRLGGSIQDQLLYNVGHAIKNCPSFKKKQDGLFGFSKGCLHMNRWDQIYNLLNQTGTKITFGLNALLGKKKSAYDKSSIPLWTGAWYPRNAYDFIKYSRSKGYQIDSYELGNELCGVGVSVRLEAEPYAEDIMSLKNIVTALYPDKTTQPRVLGPAGFYDRKWFNTFLQATGPDAVDAVTHHIYNLGAGTLRLLVVLNVDPNLINKVQDPFFLDQVAQTFKDVSSSIELFGPWSEAWVGEAGGAYNSGGKDVSHTFANSFWYLDQLGMTSTFNHKVYCRQAFIGGNYGLLNTTSFIPNPDYYGALLWHRLMGKNVLSATHSGSPYLRAYSHCSRQQPGITVILINMSKNTKFSVSVIDDLNLYSSDDQYKQMDAARANGGQQREEYHLSPKDGNIQSDVLLLNGTPLTLTESLDIPTMEPKLVDPSTPITVDPDTIVFATLRDFHAPACV